MQRKQYYVKTILIFKIKVSLSFFNFIPKCILNSNITDLNVERYIGKCRSFRRSQRRSQFTLKILTVEVQKFISMLENLSNTLYNEESIQ